MGSARPRCRGRCWRTARPPERPRCCSPHLGVRGGCSVSGAYTERSETREPGVAAAGTRTNQSSRLVSGDLDGARFRRRERGPRGLAWRAVPHPPRPGTGWKRRLFTK